jgi:hypothetical protein
LFWIVEKTSLTEDMGDMKKTLLILVLLWAGAELSAQTIVQQFAAVSAGAGEVTDMDLTKPTGKGSVLIVMPGQLSPGINVVKITDNAPDGGNTYKQVSGATSACEKQPLEIWYCENCKADVTELKFHLSGNVKASINAFLEVSDMPLSSVLDGGAQVSDGTGTSEGFEVGPSITTTATDFVIARYSSTAPRPTGVSPSSWTYKTTYVYQLNAAPGTYQPKLTGGSAESRFCMSTAAFKTRPAGTSH